MSYTPPPPGGQPGPIQYAGQNPRPATVTIAALLLYLTAALLVISTALSVFSISSVSRADLIDAIEQDPAQPEGMAETVVDITLAAVWIFAVISLVIALVFVLCGIFVARGKQWARVTSWVMGGIAVCCGLGAVAQAAGGLAGGNTASQDAMQEALAGDLPGWTTSVNTVISILTLFIAIAVIVLLALPPSNAFFRKPEPVWTPPAYPSV